MTEPSGRVIRPKDRFLILYLFFLKKFQVTATASISRFVRQGNSLLDPAEQAALSEPVYVRTLAAVCSALLAPHSAAGPAHKHPYWARHTLKDFW